MALKALYWLLVAMLVGCASVPKSVAVDEQERSRLLAAQPDWAFSGRLAYAKDGQGGTAQIQWQQRGTVSDVRISAPLALGSVRIRLDGANAQLFDSNGREIQSGPAQTAFQELLPIPIPVADLAEGVRAFWPRSSTTTQSALRGSTMLSGWHWHYLKWHEQPVRLPASIEITQQNTRLRVLIDQWQELPRD